MLTRAPELFGAIVCQVNCGSPWVVTSIQQFSSSTIGPMLLIPFCSRYHCWICSATTNYWQVTAGWPNMAIQTRTIGQTSCTDTRPTTTYRLQPLTLRSLYVAFAVPCATCSKLPKHSVPAIRLRHSNEPDWNGQVTTSTRDDRVHPGHARKLVARMRKHCPRAERVLYYENGEGGHGGAADNKQRAFMTTLAYDFLWECLGPPSSPATIAKL